nr:immunoglobulin heavy chain junction region [Macaca mulatta]MOV47457.1 immunoglobulin heavy chain junction region [Macaca mulatta]MOV47593.1 immunoglobulin heavy chain junction region [Macaca mulatta]MOV47633.1 immunoglobulin heavy chain junction region [Macaca mulatta]MOV47647.1 immunoglobulin heavy chain junction region [Macaca mulatta]
CARTPFDYGSVPAEYFDVW